MTLLKGLKLSLILIILSCLFIHLFVVNPLYFGYKKSDITIDSSKDNLIKHLENLTQTDSERDYKNIITLNNTAKYIYDEFNSYGCDEVEYQNFKIEDNEYKNVICRFIIKDTKTVIVGAHYDVDGLGYHNDSIEGKIYQGADDNASGVAGLLELARLVAGNKGEISNTIEFVAYTLEEMPYFRSENMGSYVHAKSLLDNNVEVDYMISLEMIGYFSEKNIQKYPLNVLSWIYPKNANFIAIVGKIGDFKLRNIKYNMSSNSDIDVWSINSPEFIAGITFSDHKNYWDFGMRAYMITDTSYLRNPNYHKITDTMDTLNFDQMNEVVKGVYGLITSK